MSSEVTHLSSVGINSLHGSAASVLVLSSNLDVWRFVQGKCMAPIIPRRIWRPLVLTRDQGSQDDEPSSCSVGKSSQVIDSTDGIRELSASAKTKTSEGRAVVRSEMHGCSDPELGEQARLEWIRTGGSEDIAKNATFQRPASNRGRASSSIAHDHTAGLSEECQPRRRSSDTFSHSIPSTKLCRSWETGDFSVGSVIRVGLKAWLCVRTVCCEC